MILQYQQLTGQRRMTFDWFDSKGMQREGKKIQTSGQMMNGQMERGIGWQDGHGKKHSVKYRIKQTHQGFGTRVSFKW